MYYSSEEKRSDLFLAGAVYVIGPIIGDFLLRWIPLGGVPVLGLVITFVLTIAYTVLVPFLLVRYRKQPWSEFGFTAPAKTLLTGLLVGVPVAVAGLAAGFATSGELSGTSPALTGILLGQPLQVILRLVRVFGLTLLAVYCTVLAREAFRGEPAYLRSAATHVGKFVAIAAAAATLLLLASLATGDATPGSLLTLIIQPLGVAGAVALAIRLGRASRITTKPTLATPMVLFAIGSFTIFASPQQIVVGIWSAALLAGLGLVVGLMTESERSVWGPLGFAVILGLLTYLPA